jgi:hypothetical protein
MISPTFRAVLHTSASALALGGVVLTGSLLPDQVKAQVSIPAYTTTGTLGGSTGSSTPYSFGFYFDVAGNNVNIDGLGFAAQQAWGNNTSYTVKLWSYVNGGLAFGDYTEIASATFTAGSAPSYTLQDNYYWQTFTGAPLFLPDTFTTDASNDFGYAIAAIGDFSAVAGNVVYESGTATFDPRILNAGNGFNESGFPLFPVPFNLDPALGTNGYFNANLSIVPGPLPVLGAAAGFGWTRRLRKRIRASK